MATLQDLLKKHEGCNFHAWCHDNGIEWYRGHDGIYYFGPKIRGVVRESLAWVTGDKSWIWALDPRTDEGVASNIIEAIEAAERALAKKLRLEY